MWATADVVFDTIEVEFSHFTYSSVESWVKAFGNLFMKYTEHLYERDKSIQGGQVNFPPNMSGRQPGGL